MFGLEVNGFKQFKKFADGAVIEAFLWGTGIQNWWVIIWTQIPQQTYCIENQSDYSIIIIEIKRKWDYLNFSSFYKAPMVGRRRLQLEHRPCYLQVSRKSSKWQSIIYIKDIMRFLKKLSWIYFLPKNWLNLTIFFIDLWKIRHLKDRMNLLFGWSKKKFKKIFASDL